MTRVPVAAVLAEARSVVSALREVLEPVSTGALLVTGMLSEQLARQLGAGAEPGAVIAGDAPRVAGASVVVHVIAGEPSKADEALVDDADERGVPVVLVQLWPQAEWTRPFVLSPFVVECRAGEGFPISEIARRIVEAVEQPAALARRAPVLQGPVADSVVGTAAIRAAILGALGARSGGTRPLVTLEQLRMLAQLRTLKDAPAGPEELRQSLGSLAGLAGAAVAAGFVFRGAARRGQRVLPDRFVNAAVAAAGTWALGEALRRLEERTA